MSQETDIQETDNMTKVIESLTTTAWQCYFDGDLERAFELAQELLLNSRISVFHEARMHMLLSTAKNEFAVSHAEQAVSLLDKMYENIQPPPTDKEEEARKAFLVNARQLLEKAKEEEEKENAEYDRKYAGMTDDQIIEAQIAESVQRAGDPGPNDDGSAEEVYVESLGESDEEDEGMEDEGEGGSDVAAPEDDDDLPRLPQPRPIDSFMRTHVSVTTPHPSSDLSTVPDEDQVMSDSPPHE